MFIKQFLITLTAFFAIDMVWLGLVAKNFYAKHLGFIMADKVNWPAALIFYVIFVIGLVIFIINPAMEKQSLNHLVVHALLFGLITYATYDLTNLATIKNWPLIVTIVDLIWGMTLSVSVSVISYLILTKFK